MTTTHLPPGPTFAHVLSHWATERPTLEAYRFLINGDVDGPATSLTYLELEERARLLAHQIVERNKEQRPVLLLYPSGLEFIVAFFACQYAGIPAVPASARLRRGLAAIKGIIKDCGAHLVLASKSVFEKWQRASKDEERNPSLQWYITDELDTEIESLSTDLPGLDCTAQGTAMLQYTSGSTGVPKGVVLSHENLLSNQLQIHHCFGHGIFTSDESWGGVFGVGWLPHFHDMGLIGQILHSVYLGQTTVLMSPLSFLQRPLRWLEAISHFRAHTSGGPHFGYDLCLRNVKEEQRDKLDLSDWRVAYCGAEPVRWHTVERFISYFSPAGFRSESFLPVYGLAEATLFVAGKQQGEQCKARYVDARALEEQRVVELAPGDRRARAITCCGATFGETKISVVDTDSQEICPDGTIGEIWIQGKSVASSYYGKPVLTEATFNSSCLRTGDLGFLLEDELYITGRLKDLVIIGGKNHHPEDLEHTLELAHPLVRPNACAAFSIEVKEREELVIVAEVQRNAGKDNELLEEIVRRLRQSVLNEHGVAAYSVSLVSPGSIPKTSSGKLQRQVCRRFLLRGQLEVLHSKSYDLDMAGQHLKPALDSGDRGKLRNWLCRRLANAVGLQVEEVDVRLPFNSFGLSSIQLVEIAGELSVAIGARLPNTLFYSHPTIEEVVAFVGKEKTPKLAARGKERYDEKIAIISMACRLPGGVNSPEEYWQLLCAGGQGVVEVPPDRWDIDEYYDADWEAPGKMVTRKGGFVDGIDLLDPGFFEMSPGEANMACPQQRLLLQTCWETFERAGMTREQLAGSNTGVYVGLCGTEYGYRVMKDERAINAYGALGTVHSAIVGRLSYWLGLEGPNFPVDTACSSSLVALHLACQALRAGECEQAIAAGVNVLLDPAGTIYFTKLGAMSPTGLCRSFDGGANGYVRGEGCGALLLKTLSAAKQDGDEILAIIRGSAINQDGQSNGFTSPSGKAQQEVIQRALKQAHLQPSDIDYVEAHGTGTIVGDPIEVNALGELMRDHRTKNNPLFIGSVKSNIGHLEGAAGVASVIKSVLMLQNQRLVPSLHFENPNPHIPWQELPVQVVTEAAPWPHKEKNNFVGVSAFGFSGTNAHVLLEGAEPKKIVKTEESEEARQTLLLPISARGAVALKGQVEKLRDYVSKTKNLSLVDLAWNLATRRSHFSHRLSFLASTVDEFLSEMDCWLSSEPTAKCVLEPERIQLNNGLLAFMFTGQGAQVAGMGKLLWQTIPQFRSILDEIVSVVDEHLDRSLFSIMFAEDGTEEAQLINQTAYTQPSLFAIELALARLLCQWGIKPDFVLGHSVGEVAAATLAGVFNQNDAARLVVERGKLMQALPAGAMAAVRASEDLVRTIIEPMAKEVAVAAINGPRQCVISGNFTAIDKAVETLLENSVAAKKLRVSHAFHSPMMDSMLNDFDKVCQSLDFQPPTIKFVSNLTGGLVDEEIARPKYWVDHVRSAVRFTDGITCCSEKGVSTFVEIGPSPILCAMGASVYRDKKRRWWLPSLKSKKVADNKNLMGTVATLHQQGRKIDWQRVYEGPRPTLNLPTYAFAQKRYWVEDSNIEKSTLGSLAKEPGDYKLAGQLLEIPSSQSHRVIKLSLEEQPYLQDHVVHGHIVVPGAFYVSLALAVAADHFGSTVASLKELQFIRPLVLSEPTLLHVTLAPVGDNECQFTISSGLSAPFATHVTGYMQNNESTSDEPDCIAIAEDSTAMEVGALYGKLAETGVELGPKWHWTKTLEADSKSKTVRSKLEAPKDIEDTEAPLHPALIDNVFAASMAAVLDEVLRRGEDSPRLPFAISRLSWRQGSLDGLSVSGRYLEEESGEGTFSLSLINSLGERLLSITGFQVRLAPQKTFLKLAGIVPKAPVFTLQWRKERAQAKKSKGKPCRWLLLSLLDRHGELAAQSLQKMGHTVRSVSLEKELSGKEMTQQVRELSKVLLKECKKEDFERVLLLTNNAVRIGDEELSPLAYALWGFCRSWRFELPKVSVQSLDLLPREGDFEQAVHELVGRSGPTELAFRQGQLYSPDLHREETIEEGEEPLNLAGATAIITGGLGYLGLQTAKQLRALHKVSKLVLVGRSAAKEDALAAIKELQDEGALVDCVQADVSDYEKVHKLMADIGSSLKAIVHCAGVLDDGLLVNQTAESFARVLVPKAIGAWNLHRAALALKLDLSLFVCFSSLVATLGSPGQTNYAMANAFLDGLCAHRRAKSLPSISLAWGPWLGGGMASKLGGSEAKRLQKQGINSLEAEEANKLFSSAIKKDQAFQLLASLDFVKMAKAFPREAVPPPLARVIKAAQNTKLAAKDDGFKGRLLALPMSERSEELLAALRQEAARMLLLDDVNSVPIDLPLQEIGFDSLTATELRGSMLAKGLEIPLGTLFDKPTLQSLARQLAKKLSGQESLSKSDKKVKERLTVASSGQKRLWFLNSLSPRKELYHVYFELRAEGPVSPAILRETLTLLIDRHEALRWYFPVVEGEVQRFTLPPYEPFLPLHDFSCKEKDEALANYQSLKNMVMSAPFDLSREVPIRFTLIKMGEGDYRLLVTQHHIITDGWSLNVFTAEMAATYQALQAGAKPDLPAIDRSFQAFVQAEQKALDEGLFDDGLSYWKEQLKELPTLSLPTIPLRRERRSFKGAVVPFHFSQELSARLISFSKDAKTTVFSTTASLFSLLLRCFCEEDDIPLGTAVANRQGVADRFTLGFFVSTVVLRIQVKGKLSFKELVSSTAQTISEALAHSEVPFDKVVEAVAPERKGLDNPLFQVCLVQETPPSPVKTPAGLQITPYMAALDGAVPGTAKFALTVVFSIENGCLHGSFEYARELLAQDTVERMVKHFENLAELILASPEKEIDDFSLLNSKEREKVLLWGTGEKSSQAEDETLVHSLYEEQVRKKPQAIAIRCAGESLTFHELDNRANHLALQLKKSGVQQGDRVLLLLPRGLAFVVSVLAVLKSGAAYVPIEADVPKSRRLVIMDDVQAKLVINEETYESLAASYSPRSIVEGAAVQSSASDTCYVMFTSGSTGRPKGARISHKNLVNYLRWKVSQFPPREEDKLLFKTSVGFDSAVGEMWYALAAGVELIVAPQGAERDLDYLLSTLSQENVTLFKAVPSLYRALVATGRLVECDKLRLLWSGGEPLSTRLAIQLREAAGARLVNLYGPAEATVSASFHEFSAVVDSDSSPYVPIGRPIDGAKIYLVDRARKLSPVGVVGEILIGGKSVGKGYVKESDVNQSRFISNPFGDGRLYCTGDLGRWNKDGELEFIGRRDTQIQLRGQRMELGEVEVCLEAIRGVKQACALLLEPSSDNPTLVAYVEAESEQLSSSKLRAKLGKYLPNYMLPSRLVIVQALPRLTSGKVDRKTLAEGPQEFTVEAQVVAPSTNTERTLLRIWRHFLPQIAAFGVYDDFFTIGGDSLLAVQVMLETQRHFPGTVALATMFTHTDIASLASFIDGFGLAKSHVAYGQVKDDDVLLPQDISFPQSEEMTSESGNSDLDELFFTGATGLLGAQILASLLKDTKSKVHCLVRADNDEQAWSRIETLLVQEGFDKEIIKERVSIHRGNLALREFGLPSKTFNELANGCSAILHNGAWVNHAHKLETLKPTNVGSVVEVIRLATLGRMKTIHFVSTLGVFGRHFDENCDKLLESVLPDAPPRHSGYGQSKWLGERLLQMATDRGQPVAIYRPCLILNDSLKTWPMQLLRACLKMNAIPSGAWPSLPALSTEYAAAAVVHLAKRVSFTKESKLQVFHLTHGEPLSEEHLLTAMDRAKLSPQKIDYDKWRSLFDKKLAEAQGVERNELASLAAILPTNDLTSWCKRPTVDDSMAQRLLKDLSINKPSADELMHRSLSFVRTTLLPGGSQ